MNHTLNGQTVLEGTNLRLRPLRASDAEALMTTSNDPRTQQWTTIPSDYTLEMAHDWISNATLVWALADPITDAYLGSIDLRPAEHQMASVGYVTAPWARGRGLQTQALQMLMDYAFANGIHRIEVCVALDNAASRHVAEVAGCTFEGVRRAGQYCRGQWSDLAVYSRLSTD
ncbi:GNAT family N-acetyltransferase [Schaalia suimastitidis]|uniref:GNAT family N-acetyltransferase n=1 Tax=Schaalia suimastitidis TaxID=121163 RepID=UPI0003F897B0|nr:GNAT family protein [Schaalia suimastitidis]